MKKTKIMKATKKCDSFISSIIFIIPDERIEQALFKFYFSSGVFQRFL